ncbi:MAG: HAD-IA family hydrolase [Rhizobiaceae bacterium]|nr:HAD-IA family hydrolase [Rhizobiaceae bacterium]
MADAAKIVDPGFSGSTAALRPLLSPAFPWHSKELRHDRTGSADAWWAEIESYSKEALKQFGFSNASAEKAAGLARSTYLDIAGWKLIDGALKTLGTLSGCGWIHIIMSNFAPELDEIVDGLGLSPLIAMSFSSARIGLEKPHEGFFRHVFEQLGESRAVWMIGDNVHADIQGARTVGLKSVLVWKPSDEADHAVSALPQVVDVVGCPRLR